MSNPKPSRWRSAAALALALLCSLCNTSAWAQDDARAPTSFQVEHFEPLPAQGTNILNIGKSDLLPHLSPSAGVFFHLVNDPLQLVDENGEVQDRLISNQVKGEFWLSMGFFEWADLGLVLPVVLFQGGDDLRSLGLAGTSIDTLALADLRIVPKFRFINPEWAGGFGAALLANVYLPLGDTNSFNSDGAFRIEPRLALDYRHDVGLAVAANIGYQLRPKTTSRNIVTDDSLRYGLGLELPTGVDGFQLIGSFFGTIALTDNLDPDNLNANQTIEDARNEPMELLGGVQFALPYNLVAQAGGGGGISMGVGSPDFRVFASFGYTPRNRDKDGDGILDRDDGCPERPEDMDDFEDSDGCPDVDNDKDGILDDDDQCRNDPEDIDQFEDKDGCPDPDNDQDSVLDTDDKCPLEAGLPDRQGCPLRDKDGDGIEDKFDVCPDEPEDKDEFQDEDGCPDKDNDADGILDKVDKCPLEKEDKDGFEDEDGCPDPDNDQDGIPDTKDKCPNKKEVINGVKDDDGCPDKGKSKVRITRTKIEILEKVYFDKNKAKIKSRSFNLLNQVALIIKANPQITKLRVEGHTDERGKDDYNLDLSERRAASVKTYLERQGVPAAKIISKGYGENQPVDDCSKYRRRRKKNTCWAKNRRVEFTILEVNGKPVGAEGAIIEKKEVIDPDKK